MTFRIRAGKRGLQLRLHELEAEIMDVVWSKRLSSFAVGDVVTFLEKRRPVAYTTIMTTVARLHAKGVLARERDGKRYLYSPKLSREDFLASTAREVLQGAVNGHQAITLLAESVSKASLGELETLEALIERRRKELGE